MASELPTAFSDLKASDFPFKIELLNAAGEVLYESTVAEPGVLRMPGLAAEHGPITARLTFPNGHVVTEGPP